MDITSLTNYFIQYGPVLIFVIVLLEYMNLPGFPAGVIMPLAGIWASKGDISFFATMVLSVLAGLLGSWILYFVGRIGGGWIFNVYFKKFPKQQALVQGKIEMLQEKGGIGIFISKLVPLVRTIISIPAGMIRMNFLKYTVSSTLGVLVWNLIFIGAGYLLGDTVFQMF